MTAHEFARPSPAVAADLLLVAAAIAVALSGVLPWRTGDWSSSERWWPLGAALFTSGALGLLALRVTPAARAPVVLSLAAVWSIAAIVLLVNGDAALAAPILALMGAGFAGGAVVADRRALRANATLAAWLAEPEDHDRREVDW